MFIFKNNFWVSEGRNDMMVTDIRKNIIQTSMAMFFKIENKN